MPTSEMTYRIEMESLSRCWEHMRCLDLAGMQQLAVTYGTDAERRMIAATQAALLTLP